MSVLTSWKYFLRKIIWIDESENDISPVFHFLLGMQYDYDTVCGIVIVPLFDTQLISFLYWHLQMLYFWYWFYYISMGSFVSVSIVFLFLIIMFCFHFILFLANKYRLFQI